MMRTRTRRRLAACIIQFLAAVPVSAAEGSAPAHPAPILKATPHLEQIQRNAVYEARRERNNLDVVSKSFWVMSSEDEPPPAAFCHMISLNNYNFRGPFLRFSLEALAAMELAVEHLNTGNGTLIEEVHGLNERCPIRFTMEHFDTMGTENVAVDQLIPILQRQQRAEAGPYDGKNGSMPPCAFVGPFFSAEAVATALYTSLKGYPQFAPMVTAIELDNKETFPLFGRFVPPSASFASPLLEFLVETLQIEHLAVLHTDQSTDLTYVSGLRETIKKEYPQLHMQAFSFNLAGEAGTNNNYEAVVAAVKRTGYRYIFNLVESKTFLQVLEEAQRQGIVGPSYTWISGSLGSINTYFLNREFLPEDPLAQMAGGFLSFDVTRKTQGKLDLFREAWEDLGKSQADLEFLQSKVPLSVVPYGRGQPLFTNATFDQFFDAIATQYDVVVSLGLAACANQSTAATSAGTASPPHLTGQQHYEYMLKQHDNTTKLEGASGPLILDQKTGSRDPRSIFYEITNVVPYELPSGNITYRTAKTHFFGGGRGWTELEPILFSDNTTTLPADLPPQEIDNNHLGWGLRSAGLLMSAVVIMSSLGLAMWTLEHKSSRIVLASQPIFLLIILFGAFLMGASIIPKSLDDEVVSENGASIACATFPWLLTLGWCCAFAALFSKTYRINKIFHNPNFKRVKIEAKDVMIPMVTLLGCNVLILGLWTGLDPLTWERYVVGYDPFGRPNKTMGECTSETMLPYLLSLGVVNLGTLVVAIHQAWIARRISLEFAESEWIARVMNAILMVSFVGCPVLLIADEDPSAFYFVLSAIIFVIAMALLIFIFGPKVVETRSKAKTKASKFAIQQTLNNIQRKTEVQTAPFSSPHPPSSDPELSDPEMSDLDIDDGRSTDSGPTCVTCGSSNTFGLSGLAEGAKVLNHPALQEAKDAEMKQLKKEKKKLRRRLQAMERQQSRREETAALIECTKHEMQPLEQAGNTIMGAHNNLRASASHSSFEPASERNLAQQIPAEAELQQEIFHLRGANAELKQQLDRKTQELEVQRLRMAAREGKPKVLQDGSPTQDDAWQDDDHESM